MDSLIFMRSLGYFFILKLAFDHFVIDSHELNFFLFMITVVAYSFFVVYSFTVLPIMDILCKDYILF